MRYLNWIALVLCVLHLVATWSPLSLLLLGAYVVVEACNATIERGAVR